MVDNSMNTNDAPGAEDPLELDPVARHAQDVLSQDAYRRFQLWMLLEEIRNDPAKLAEEPVTRRHAQDLYQDPRTRLQIEIVMREQHLFPPDAWAACFAPDPVPTKKYARASRGNPLPQPSISQGDAVEALALLQEKWHPEITGVIRHGYEQPAWYLRLRGRTLALGSTRQLQDQTHIRGVLFEATQHMIAWVPQSHRAEWDQLLEALASVALLIDAPDLTLVGQASELVLCYLESQYYSFAQDFDTEEWETCARKNMPFRDAGTIYIHARHFHGHYVHLMAPGVSYPQCLEYLHGLGARNVRITVNNPPRTSRSYWKLPPDWISTAIEPPPEAREEASVRNNGTEGEMSEKRET